MDIFFSADTNYPQRLVADGVASADSYFVYAIANPRFAPCGVAAREALIKFDVLEETRDRLVLGENIAQTAHFVESGVADVGILALSLAMSPELKQKGTYWTIPGHAHPPIDQAAIIPIHSKKPEAADRLRDFDVAPEGRTILAEFGDTPLKE